MRAKITAHTTAPSTDAAATAPNSDAIRLGSRLRRRAQRATKYIPNGAAIAAPSENTTATSATMTPAEPARSRTTNGLGEAMSVNSSNIVGCDQLIPHYGARVERTPDP